MSFDQDPNEQANISGADLAILIDDLAAYKQRAEAAEAKLRELEMQKPVAYLKPSGETRVAIPCPIGWFSKEIPLYAQPFPFHKQEVEMEIIAYLEAEPNARNEHPRDVIGSMVYSMRITKEKPKSKRNVCWALYAKLFHKQEDK